MTNVGKWWRSFVRLFAWTTDMCDGGGDPSMAKGIAAFLGGVVGYDMITKGIGAANCVAAGLVLAAAFGRSTFMHWLDRNTWSGGATVNASTSINTNLTGDLNEIAKTVLARRDPASGVDPA